MEKVTLVMVGIGGFGNYYIHSLLDTMDKETFSFIAVVDPIAEKSPAYPRIVEEKISVYPTLEEFYENGKADLVLICSPVQFHLQQIRCAFAHGSHVMCEKPLTVFASDVETMEKEAQEAGLLLGVGFQWSFARQCLLLKRHILEGRYGKIKEIRTFVNFRRNDQYYNSWHGHLYQKNGELLLDSIISNATAHYLHMGLFMNGKTMDESQMPKSVRGTLYRTKKIDSFDTCDVVCTFEDGTEQKMFFSHGADGPRNIIFYRIDMEEAVATLDPVENGSEHLIVRTKDGQVLDYDDLSGTHGLMEDKINAMIEAVSRIKNGEEASIPCHPATTLPFAMICNSLFAELPIHDFPKERVVHITDDGYGPFESDIVPRLYADLLECYRSGKTPCELGKEWAIPDEKYELKTAEEYRKVLSDKFERQ